MATELAHQDRIFREALVPYKFPSDVEPLVVTVSEAVRGRITAGVAVRRRPDDGDARIAWQVADEQVWMALGELLAAVGLKDLPVPASMPQLAAVPTHTPTSSAIPAPWYALWVAYSDSAVAAYAPLPAAVMSWWNYVLCGHGLSEEECAANEATRQQTFGPMAARLEGHIAFIAANPAPPCLADAYSTDREIATAWRDLLERKVFPGDTTPEGIAVARETAALIDRTVAHLGGLGAYASDCR